MSVRLPYGLAPNGRLVAVADVPRGRQGDVVCPGCRSALVARKGEVNRHHFAHAVEADCAGAYETMLHLLGKQVIRDAGAVRLPAVVADIGTRRREVAPARPFEADRAEVEAAVGRYRADVVLHGAAGPLVVEILVTHRTTPEKVKAFESLGVEAIEIDLSHLLGAEDLTNVGPYILREAPRSWLHNAQQSEALAELRDYERRDQERIASIRRRYELRVQSERAEALRFLAEKQAREAVERERARVAAAQAPSHPVGSFGQKYDPSEPDALRDGLLRGFAAHRHLAPPARTADEIYGAFWS